LHVFEIKHAVPIHERKDIARGRLCVSPNMLG
jgi:hypothetical protein